MRVLKAVRTVKAVRAVKAVKAVKAERPLRRRSRSHLLRFISLKLTRRLDVSITFRNVPATLS